MAKPTPTTENRSRAAVRSRARRPSKRPTKRLTKFFAALRARCIRAQGKARRWAQVQTKRLTKPFVAWHKRTLPTRRKIACWIARLLVAGVTAGLTLALTWPADMSAVIASRSVSWGSTSWGIARHQIAAAITPALLTNQFPTTISLPGFPITDELKVRYTIDPDLQGRVKKMLRRYRPDYGAFVALDPDTGRVLAMASRRRNGDNPGNMAMVNSYPAASISKIITAVAAINEDMVNTDTMFPFNGKASTLYKKHVLHHREHKWTRNYSFGRAFARSVNTVFGRVGALVVGGETMLFYARRLGFNASFDSDFTFGNGAVVIDTKDPWQAAEMASGFTNRNTLSPLHGAILAATAINGGHLVAPFVVEEITGPNGVPLYWHEVPHKSKIMHADTAQQLKEMMRATIAIGSAKIPFARFSRRSLKDAVVGGKTGSLSGRTPKGRYDWFVGFAELGQRKIAFAVLCINKEKWYVKSSQLAREILEPYFRHLAKQMAVTTS